MLDGERKTARQRCLIVQPSPFNLLSFALTIKLSLLEFVLFASSGRFIPAQTAAADDLFMFLCLTQAAVFIPEHEDIDTSAANRK